MKKSLALAAVAAIAMLAGTGQAAKADHNRCSPYNRGFSSFGYSSFGYSPYRSWSRGYSFSPRYYGYSRPSYGFSYSRPGFSLSIGRGYSHWGLGRSYGFSRNRGHHHHHHHRH